jgi:hypothetical protein
VRLELLIGAVTPAWLRRRRLVVLVRSFDSNSNDDELELDLFSTLSNVLKHEGGSVHPPGCAISILWIGGDDRSAERVEDLLRRMVRRKGEEWSSRVALNCVVEIGGGGRGGESRTRRRRRGTFSAPNPSDLERAGVRLASFVLVPVWRPEPSLESDDVVSLYVSTIRLMCEVSFFFSSFLIS